MGTPSQPPSLQHPAQLSLQHPPQPNHHASAARQHGSAPESPDIEVAAAASADDIAAVADLFREYADTLGVDLSFQSFDAELAGLPGDYAPPRGELLVARVDGVVVGCCALRPLDASDYPNAAEMKRLYVRQAVRGFGLGRLLSEATLDAARRAGYSCVLLDTLDEMEAARALYEDLGFEEIPPYYHSPLRGTHYLRVEL